MHWDIDADSKLLVTKEGVATATRAVHHDYSKVQGATTINDKYYMNQSGGNMVTFSWQGGEKVTKGTFPAVPEDLSYQAGFGLWGLMEVPGNRHVVAVDHKKF